tara:strand:- start:41119 stop:41307 length:189 start_codon:yes stop_codon:yes gene_type:complete
VGDWHLWNGKTNAAWAVYQQAATELAREDGAEERAQMLFGEPVALPAMADVSLLPPVAPANE